MYFSNPLHESIYQKIVKPAMSQVTQKIRGTVIKFHAKEKRCIIEFGDPNTGSLRRAYAPIQIAGGVNNPGPFPGEEVLIDFPSNNYTSPVITGVVDVYYSRCTRGLKQLLNRKGAFIPDDIGERTGEL